MKFIQHSPVNEWSDEGGKQPMEVQNDNNKTARFLLQLTGIAIKSMNMGCFGRFSLRLWYLCLLDNRNWKDDTSN